MRIGIYDPYLDTLGGGEKYMLTAASVLSRKHEVFLFWDGKDEVKKATQRFGIDLSQIRVVRNIFSSEVSLLEKLKDSISYDYILYLSDGSIPLVLSRKLILHFQFPIEWVYTNKKITKVKLSRVSGVICNSQYTKKYIDQKLKLNSTVIFPPVEIQKLHATEKKENIILTVGRYSRLPEGGDFKKHAELIQAFIKLRTNQKAKNWKLAVATNYLPQDEKYAKEIEHSAKDPNIQVYTNIPNSDLLNLYKKSKIYWHAAGLGEDLSAHPERAEHFGISTVEAMAAGEVPVVIRAGGQMEIVEDNVNGLLWKTKDELLKKTISLINDQSSLKKLSQKAIKRAEEFSDKKFTQHILEYFV